MQLTPFGKGVRRHRIDLEVKLKDMADALQVSSSYLSAVEIGTKPLTQQLTERVVGYFERFSVDANDLFGLACETQDEVKISLNGMNNESKLAVMSFARRLPDIPSNKLEELLESLNEMEKKT